MASSRANQITAALANANATTTKASTAIAVIDMKIAPLLVESFTRPCRYLAYGWRSGKGVVTSHPPKYFLHGLGAGLKLP